MKIQMKHISKTLPSLSVVLLAIGTTQTQAVTISYDFATDAQFDNNFVVLSANGSSTIERTTISLGPVLSKTGTGSQSVIYDTSATGGSGGTGGTSGSGADKYIDVTTSADMRVTTLNTPSLGLWSRVGDDYTSGYLGLINPISSSQVRLRIFDSNSNPSSSGVGVLLFDQTFNSGGTTISTGDFYVAEFTTTNTLSDQVDLSLSFSTTDGTTIASTTITDTTSPVLTSGQVGFRASSTTLFIDNYTVTSVPEPSVYAAGLGGLALLYCMRRRQQNKA